MICLQLIVQMKMLKFIENYRTETFIPSLLSTLETIRQGMLDEFKKWFTGMMIDLLWTTILDPRRWSLRHLNQNEIQVAKNKLIKEVIGVPSKEVECADEDNGSKKNHQGFWYLWSSIENNVIIGGQQQIILNWGWQKNCLDRCLWRRSWELLGLFLWLWWQQMWFLWIGGKFIDINPHALPNLQENGCAWLLHQLLPKECYLIVG